MQTTSILSKEPDKVTEKFMDSLDEKALNTKRTFFSRKENEVYITWKAVGLLKRHITRFADMKPRHFTNLGVSQQKKIRKAILRARELGFLPYIR